MKSTMASAWRRNASRMFLGVAKQNEIFTYLGGGWWMVIHVFFVKKWRLYKKDRDKKQKVGPTYEFEFIACWKDVWVGESFDEMREVCWRSVLLEGQAAKTNRSDLWGYGEVVCFFWRVLNVWNMNAFWLDRDCFGGCTLSYLICLCIIGYMDMGLDALFSLTNNTGHQEHHIFSLYRVFQRGIPT